MATSMNRFEARWQPRVGAKGVALIEALIGLAVVFAGSAAIFGIHSHVMGSSSEARLQTAAMTMAQAQLETFRNWEFDQLIDPDNLEGEDSATFDNPGVFGSSAVNLTWCWRIEQELPDPDTSPDPASLVQISVNVARPGTACDANDDQGLARLQTLVARQDPRVAARNVAQRLVRDGEGRLVDNYEEPAGSTGKDLPSGFREVRDGGGNLLAVVNPVTKQAIVPKEEGGALKVAMISGNVFLDGARTSGYFSTTRIAGDGVAICRVDGYDPGDTTVPLPAISGAGHTVSYVRYSCVVADQWRREVLVGPMLNERVCVGNPELIQQGGLLMVREQVIRGLRRFYVAREYTGYDAEKDGGNYTTEPLALLDDNDEPILDEDDLPTFVTVIANRFPVGMRGSNDPAQPAAIGSVLPAGDSLWVPGGHHFFVVEVPEGFDAGAETTVFDEVVVTAGDMKCAEAMEKLEQANADQGRILVRNLSNLYCTNAKEYSIKVKELGYTGRDCISTTRISGFVNPAPAAAVTTDPAAHGASFCVDMDVPTNVRGAYLCGFPEDTGPIKVLGSGLPAQDPLDWEHDIVSQDFTP
jgi:hypothetical protein